jgi:hypothetical protein
VNTKTAATDVLPPTPERPVFIKPVDEVQIILPSKQVQGEIRFIMNNLSKANHQAKVRTRPITCSHYLYTIV